MDCYTVSSQTSEYLAAASDLVFIYDMMSDGNDRSITKERISAFIKKRINYYAERAESFVGTVNNDISHTKSPGMAASALRLKEELRKVAALLKSTDISKH